MFVRVKGTEPYRYLQVVENHREGKRTVQRVLCTLGRVDQLTASGATDALLRSLARFGQQVPLVDGYESGRLEAGLEGDWRLLLVGEGPLRREIEEEAVRLGLGPRVRLLGGVPSGEMPSRYAEMDVLAVPSLTVPHWKEQFGRVIVEAMACGVPVVGSDSGEIPQVMGEAGLLCPEGDAEALRSALRRLWESPELRLELGRRGRERVLAHYTQKRVAEETVAFYESVLGCNVIRAT